MGAGNVGLVYAKWSHLNHAPFRVLVYMAHRALDKGDPPLFWGGREELAFALGRTIPEGNDDESIRVRKAAFDLVKKTTEALRRAGAVTLERPSKSGSRALYALHLRDGLVGTQTPPEGGTQTPPLVGTETPAVGGTQTPPIKEDVGVSRSKKQGIDGETNHQPAGDAHARDPEKNGIHPFDFTSASLYLLQFDGDTMLELDHQATAELGPDATREQIVIRAATIAHNGSAP